MLAVAAPSSGMTWGLVGGCTAYQIFFFKKMSLPLSLTVIRHCPWNYNSQSILCQGCWGGVGGGGEGGR